MRRRAVRTQEMTWDESPFITNSFFPVASAIATAVFTAKVAARISDWFPEFDSHKNAEEKGHKTEQHTHAKAPRFFGRSGRNPPSKHKLVGAAAPSAAALQFATFSRARPACRCCLVLRSGGGRCSSSLSSPLALPLSLSLGVPGGSGGRRCFKIRGVCATAVFYTGGVGPSACPPPFSSSSPSRSPSSCPLFGSASVSASFAASQSTE